MLRFKKEYSFPYTGISAFVHLMKNVKCFRNLFYLRVRPFDKALSFYYRKDSTLYFAADSLLGGVVFHHPFSSIINAKHIGTNCTIRHLTTIGNKNNDHNQRPTILNNVDIGAGVIIIGDITIGNNCVVGAGSVVTKSTPDNSIVGGNPAKILFQDGIRIKNS